MKYHRHLLNSCSEALTSIFFEGRYADKCIEYYLRNNKKWGGRDRRFFAETVYDCVRWWTLYWYLLDREPKENDLEILGPSLWNRNMELPDLEEFENLSTSQFQSRSEKLEDPWLKAAMPKWLFEYVEAEIGPQWHDIVGPLNLPNQLVLRANTQKIKAKQLVEQLKKEDVVAQRLKGSESGLIIKKRVNIFRTEAFKRGLFEVQDGSSQQVARFLNVEPGHRVIDACAGAGGKSLHIADLLDNRGKVISMDIHQWKLDQLKLRARRNSYSNIERKLIEGSKSIKRLKGTADRLLLDVPCTGLGVIRRNPDTKWKLTKDSIAELVELQRTILTQYASMLKVGGQMVYATCSILPAENQEQVRWFIDKNPNFTLLKQRHIYPTRPGYDGFFMALLEKNN